MAKENKFTQADGKDPLTVQGFGTQGYTISAADYYAAFKFIREAGIPAGGPTTVANSGQWPFDGVLGRV
jgi:hypothetical protein